MIDDNTGDGKGPGFRLAVIVIASLFGTMFGVAAISGYIF